MHTNNNKREAVNGLPTYSAATQRQLAEPAFGWGGRCRYHADSWYYEIGDLARKLVLTGVMVFVARDSSVQIAVGCLVNFAVLLGNVAMRPCADPVVGRPLSTPGKQF